MRVHTWVAEDNALIVTPDMVRVWVETGLAAALMAALCIGIAAINSSAVPMALLIAAPFVALIHLRQRHRRARLTVSEGRLKIESSTWMGAGRWVDQAELPTDSIREVGHYQSAQTTRIVVACDGGPGFVVMPVLLRPSEAAEFARTLGARVRRPASRWTRKQFIAALRG